jgi:uncharacterized membrane protein
VASAGEAWGDSAEEASAAGAEASAAAAGVSAAAARAAAGEYERHDMNAFLKSYFSASDLTRIAAAISELERTTSGEIRVSVVRQRRWSERSLPLEELAQRDFYRLGMDKTKDATGVLLFLLLGERKFRIVADRGINERVPQGTWDEIGSLLASHFKEEHYLGGVLEALRRIGAVLEKHFPRRSDDTDELTNSVELRS